MAALITSTPKGLYCPAGDFYVDPWRCDKSMRAVITHAHSDHARSGCGSYLASHSGSLMLKARLGESCPVQPQQWGLAHSTRIGDVKVSLHPAGHVLGSAQIRIERVGGTPEPDEGGTWVITGDYKLEADGVTEPFESVACDTLITESTFGLPIYRWRPNAELCTQISDWWRQCQRDGRVAVIFCYSLGKAQRVLAGVDSSIGPILGHGAVIEMTRAYRQAGPEIDRLLPAIDHATKAAIKELRASGSPLPLVIAPPSTDSSTWLRSLGDTSCAVASGWMQIRGTRRRQSLDRGFVMSDHVDWPGLLQAVELSGASSVGVTHGYVAPVVRWLSEHGKQAFGIATHFEGESAELRPKNMGDTSELEVKASAESDHTGRLIANDER